ncbi:MAG: SAM-dependent DNA methyltransferase, partial [Flavobacteriales bacterium]|nr:SAM-dependent DNA methyltransferase [Flavobacteriales bacterium]
NTGIATYVWVLSNRKPEHRQGKVQLIDATQWYKPLRKNLGSKNCELGEEDIQRIVDLFLKFEETGHSKIFPNEAFGYWKVKVERPLRLRARFTREAVDGLAYASGDEDLRQALHEQFGDALGEDFAKVKKQVEAWLDDYGQDEGDEEDGTKTKGISEAKRKKLLDPKKWQRDLMLADLGARLLKRFGDREFADMDSLEQALKEAFDEWDVKLGVAEKKVLLAAVTYRDPEAPPVVKKLHKPGKAEPDAFHGLFPVEVKGKTRVVEYEPDSELRDYEQVPLLEEGGIEAFIQREVLPYAPDAWVDPDYTRIGYEISFNRYFYKPQPLRSLEEIRADIVDLEKETEGLLQEIINA